MAPGGGLGGEREEEEEKKEKSLATTTTTTTTTESLKTTKSPLRRRRPAQRRVELGAHPGGRIASTVLDGSISKLKEPRARRTRGKGSARRTAARRQTSPASLAAPAAELKRRGEVAPAAALAVRSALLVVRCPSASSPSG